MGPDAGTEGIVAVPAPLRLPVRTAQASPQTSRYYALRGKSVSSVRRKTFGAYDDEPVEHNAGRPLERGLPPLPLPPPPTPPPPPPPRRRTKDRAVTSSHQGGATAGLDSTRPPTPISHSKPKSNLLGPVASLNALGPHHELYPDLPIPPIPANLVLSPKPTNVPSALPNKQKLKGILIVSDDPVTPPRTPVLDDIIRQRCEANRQAFASNNNHEIFGADSSPPADTPPKTLPALSSDQPLLPHSPPLSPDLPLATDVGPGGPATARACADNPQPNDRREAAQWAREVARLEAETDRILAEQKKRDIARLQASLATSPRKSRPRSISRSKSGILRRLNFFSRTKPPKTPKVPALPVQTSEPGSPETSSSTIFSLDLAPPSTSQSSASFDIMALYDRGATGLLAQADAPTSAVNGGERRVTVRCLSSTINLPVSTETTTKDILFSSANLVTHNINPNTSVLVECYANMGLERRLRRYEHIRDVMNSWDRDAQNSLMVVSLEADDDGQDLDISSVPRSQEPPRGFSFQLSCSSRRGKWDKRWVNLLDSGQIFVAKKPDAKPTDKDSTALCHLSDFDIYIPKESETRRRIRAPHKYCYAVKSQQKSIVFPDGENFVHFFSTDDSEVAHHFFALIHGWRSWYLANKLGQFEKKSSSTTAMPTRSATQKTTRRPTVTDNSYKLPLSTDDTPYTIGAFEPFLDLDRFNKPLEEFGKDLEPNAKSERTLSKRGHNPKAPVKAPPLPGSLPSKAAQQVKQQTKRPPVVDTSFSVSGLLGSAYEKRKQSIEASESTVTKDKEEGPFTGGSSLLNTVAITSPDTMTPAESKTWFPSAEEHSARNRSRTNASTNPPPAVRSQSTRSARTPRRPQTSDGPQARKDRQTTLVNLTNSFPQPPQWRDKGQSHSAKAPAGAPLINFATGGTMPGQFPVNGGPPRGFMRSPSGRSASSTYDDPSAPAAQAGSRSRSRSVTARHRALEDAPPVPPLPVRSLTRDALLQSGGGAVSRGRHMPEPLVSRAR